MRYFHSNFREVGTEFDRLSLIYGLDPIVHACKARAARPQPVITVVDEPTTVYAE